MRVWPQCIMGDLPTARACPEDTAGVRRSSQWPAIMHCVIGGRGGVLMQLYHCDGTENHMIITVTFWYVLDNVCSV